MQITVLTFALVVGMILAVQGQGTSNDTANANDAPASNTTIDETNSSENNTASTNSNANSNGNNDTSSETPEESSSGNGTESTDDQSSASNSTQEDTGSSNSTQKNEESGSSTDSDMNNSTEGNNTVSDTPETNDNMNTSSTNATSPDTNETTNAGNGSENVGSNSTLGDDTSNSNVSNPVDDTDTNETNTNMTNSNETNSSTMDSSNATTSMNMTNTNETKTTNMTDVQETNSTNMVDGNGTNPTNMTNSTETSSMNDTNPTVQNDTETNMTNSNDTSSMNDTNPTVQTDTETNMTNSNDTSSMNDTNPTVQTDTETNMTNSNDTSSMNDTNSTVPTDTEGNDNNNGTESETQCKLPEELPGIWWSTMWGAVTFTDNRIVTQGDQQLTFECFARNNENENYILRQLNSSFSSSEEENVLTCVQFTFRNRDNVNFLILTDRNDNLTKSEPVLVTTMTKENVDFETICTAMRDTVLESDLIRKGREVEGALGCPDLLHGTFDVTYKGQTATKCPNGATMNSCEVTRTLVYNYTNCNGTQDFAGENRYVCSSGGANHVTTFRNSTEKNDFTPFACLVINSTDTSNKKLSVAMSGFGCGDSWAMDGNDGAEIAYTLNKNENCPSDPDGGCILTQSIVFTAMLALLSRVISLWT